MPGVGQRPRKNHVTIENGACCIGYRILRIVTFGEHSIEGGDRTTRIGTKSVTVQVEVEAERYHTGQSVHVTSATLSMVSVDAAGKPIPFSAAATV